MHLTHYIKVLRDKHRAGLLTIVSLAVVFCSLPLASEAADLENMQVFGGDAEKLFPFLERGKLGFIDSTGNTVIEPEFLPVVKTVRQPISNSSRIIRTEIAPSSYLNEGIARIRLPRTWWILTTGYDDAFINRDGQKLFVNDFEWIGSFAEGVAPYRREIRSNFLNQADLITLYGYVDTDGKKVTGAQFDWCGPFSDSIAPVLMGGKYGFIKHKNLYRFHGDRLKPFSEEEVRNSDYMHIPAEFEDVGYFYDGVAPAALEKDLFGLINTDGEWIVEPKYLRIMQFSEGHAVVIQSGNYGMINTKGEEIIPARYDRVFPLNDGLALVREGSRYHFIDTSGTIKASFEHETVGTYAEGLVPFRLNYRWGFVNLKDDVIIFPEYTFVRPFEGGLAQVWQDNEMGYINRRGEWVREPSR